MNLRKKLTDVDFSKHEVIIKKDELTTVHTLSLKDSCLYRVNFINVMDKLLVTGDLGNYVFCRSFIPSKEGYVSPYYWLEKLRILSEQDGEDWDSKGTREKLKEDMQEYIDYTYDGYYDFDLEENEEDETIEYYKRCIELTEEPECYYDAYAYGEYPCCWDGEDVVKVMKIKSRLQIIFDAFNEICNRLENESHDKT